MNTILLLITSFVIFEYILHKEAYVYWHILLINSKLTDHVPERMVIASDSTKTLDDLLC